jgi:hypothetical protein
MPDAFTEYDFDPHNLPQDMLAAIGLVTACSAQTEWIVEQGIAGCLGIDFEYGAAVTTHMAAPLRDHVLRAVAEIKIDDLDDLDQLDDLLDAINTAFAKRNAYAHHSWCRDPRTNRCFSINTTARGRVETALIPISVSGIVRDAMAIYEAGMRLRAFLSSRQLLPPFSPQPRSRAHKSKALRKKRRKSILGRDSP